MVSKNNNSNELKFREKRFKKMRRQREICTKVCILKVISNKGNMYNFCEKEVHVTLRNTYSLIG